MAEVFQFSDYTEKCADEMVESGQLTKAEARKNREALDQAVGSVSSGVTSLVTETEANIAGFAEVGQRSRYFLSTALVSNAMLQGTVAGFQKTKQVANHEVGHLRTTQEVEFEAAGFGNEELANLNKALGLQIETREELARVLIEGFNEKKSQREVGVNDNCAYNDEEVPVAERIDRAVKETTRKSLRVAFGEQETGKIKMAEILKDFVEVEAANDNGGSDDKGPTTPGEDREPVPAIAA